MHQKSYWIWNYGEYENYHYLKINSRRESFGTPHPTLWSMDSTYPLTQFVKKVKTEKTCFVKFHATGEGYLRINGKTYGFGTKVDLEPGEYTFNCIVSNPGGLGAIFMESDLLSTDESWVADHREGNLLPAGYREFFDSPEKSPETFPFSYEHMEPVSAQELNGGTLYDFGKETFGFLNISGVKADDILEVYYGESLEEATDLVATETYETVTGSDSYKLRQRAFRYIFIKGAKAIVSMEYEYLPLEYRGKFSCENETFNKVHHLCAYTFHLNCREMFLDGIKRDRWVWSGDTYQSGKINAYLFADPDIVRRSIIGLGGKAPVKQYINTILDYTMLWLTTIYDYYMYYGDKYFLKRLYPMMQEHMSFCETMLNEQGFIVGKPGVWTFIDWSEIDKTGAVCAEQMLLIESYRIMDEVGRLLEMPDKGYGIKAEELKKKVNEFYWNSEKGGFIDSYESGKNNVTRHANIFAIMYEIATPEQTKSIVENVLKNDAVTKITTPYFEGYELDVMAKVGEFKFIEDMVESYWGGMLKLGATSVWEEFDPTLSGAEHYAMYGRKFGKSLCHAWGAGPIYLFGRYYLGVYPTTPGFETFRVEPNLGGLKEFSGTVPANKGEVKVSLNSKELRVTATIDGGTLVWNNTEYPLEKDNEFVLNI